MNLLTKFSVGQYVHGNRSWLRIIDSRLKVINSKKPTKLNLHIGPAQIGVIKNIITINIFNLLSIILSQLLLP